MMALACAVERCLRARQHVAAHALIIDAKEDGAAAFYRHYGFVACASNPMMRYLSLGN